MGLGLGFLGLGLFCAKELWFFDVFAPNWSDAREKSKVKKQSAKLRNPDVVGMGVFIGGGREETDLLGRGRRVKARDEG